MPQKKFFLVLMIQHKYLGKVTDPLVIGKVYEKLFKKESEGGGGLQEPPAASNRVKLAGAQLEGGLRVLDPCPEEIVL